MIEYTCAYIDLRTVGSTAFEGPNLDTYKQEEKQ